MKNPYHRILLLLWVLTAMHGPYTTLCHAGSSATILWKPQKLTEEQLKFAAEHFDLVFLGGGRYVSLYSETLHHYNPQLRIISYLNSRQVLNGSPYHRECELDADLFAEDAFGNRIKNKKYDQWLMDIDNPIWSYRLVEWARALSTDIDGIFLDDASPTLHSGYTAFPANYEPNHYAASMKRLISNMKKGTDGMTIINGLANNVLTYVGYLDNADGAVFEGFIFNNNIQRAQNLTWFNVRAHLDTFIEAVKSKRIIILSPESYREDPQSRIFAYACYLLGADENSVYNFMDIDNQSSENLQYFPEYEIDLGSPLDHPNTVEDLIDPRAQLLFRFFENGMVLVNPLDFDITVSIPNTLYEIVLHGGGFVGEDGLIEAWLSYELVSGPVTITRKSAKIFWGNPAQVSADFVISGREGALPLTVFFKNLSEGVISSYYWDFGDGETSTEKNPCHTFKKVGTYPVALTVYGPFDEITDTKTDYIQVNELVSKYLIVDNADPGTFRTGYWSINKGYESWNGDSLKSGWGKATFTWTAPLNGKLKIYMWWTCAPSRDKNLRIEAYDGKKYVGAVYVDQTQNGGRWNALGTHTFMSYPRIVIYGKSGATTSADAVRFDILP